MIRFSSSNASSRASRYSSGISSIVSPELNISPLMTFNELLDLDQPPLKIQKDFKSRRMGTSAFVIYLGLDCTPQELGVTTASSFIYETLSEEAIHDRMGSLAPPLGGMLTCYNLEDSTAAPEGKSQVVLVYGASGFTGRLVTEYLGRVHPSRAELSSG